MKIMWRNKPDLQIRYRVTVALETRAQTKVKPISQNNSFRVSASDLEQAFHKHKVDLSQRDQANEITNFSIASRQISMHVCTWSRARFDK